MEQSQPDEPTQPPAESPVEKTVPAAVRKRHSWRIAFLAILSALGMFCFGTVGYGLWWYNQETKPDRSAPDIAVDNYMRAYLVEDDSAAASLYVCSNPSRLASLAAFKADIDDRERMHGISIRVTWSALNVRMSEGQAFVETDIKRSISDNSESIIEKWRFAAIDENGWRVCSAEKLT